MEKAPKTQTQALETTPSPLEVFVTQSLAKREIERGLNALRPLAMGEYLTRAAGNNPVVVFTHPVTLIKGRAEFDLHGTIRAIADKLELRETPDGPSIHEQVLTLFAKQNRAEVKTHRTADYLRVT